MALSSTERHARRSRGALGHDGALRVPGARGALTNRAQTAGMRPLARVAAHRSRADFAIITTSSDIAWRARLRFEHAEHRLPTRSRRATPSAISAPQRQRTHVPRRRPRTADIRVRAAGIGIVDASQATRARDSWRAHLQGVLSGLSTGPKRGGRHCVVDRAPHVARRPFRGRVTEISFKPDVLGGSSDNIQVRQRPRCSFWFFPVSEGASLCAEVPYGSSPSSLSSRPSVSLDRPEPGRSL